MSDEFEYEKHERLRGKVANEADSVLWTFKAYYEAADYYSKRQDWIDLAIFVISALLTVALVWGVLPDIFLISLALTSAVATGYRRAASPGDRAEEFYRAANGYHRLFDDFRDYIVLELADSSNDLDELETRYRELAARRRDLNEDTPNITSKWYDRLDESVYDEVSTTAEAKERLTDEADLLPPDRPHDLSEEEVKDRVAGDGSVGKNKE